MVMGHVIIMILIITLAVVALEIEALQEFECGEHGRFEYCIDGFSGCVVGCHCHPGFYFDTLSKICEPNTKLISEARRMNSGRSEDEVTPEDYWMTTAKSYITPLNLSPTPINATPPKNPEDLGDWLYNQFFKTIEESVVRSVNHTDNQPTRRGGGPNIMRKNTPKKRNKKKPRKTAKRFRAGKSDKAAKIDKLKKKMLRITENDSIFKSEERSRKTDQDMSDTSGSDDEGSSGDSGSESDESGGGDEKCDKHEGDYKKIVIINKKPKGMPPFVFLPSMDTPYYPPMSLPMPPAMPMYPMVPVPPYCSDPMCEQENQSSTTAVTTSSEPPPTTQPPTEPPTDDAASETTEAPHETTENALRSRISAKKFNMNRNNNAMRNKQANLMHEKLMQQFKRKKKMRTTEDSNVEHPQDIIPPIQVPKYSVESLRQSEAFKRKDPVSRLKYLSDLIHRGKDQAGSSPIKPVKTRRFGNPNIDYPRPAVDYDYQDAVINEADPNTVTNDGDANNQFYNDLGRQIAAVIQGFDDTDYQDSPIFDEDTLSGRRYFDRSARSSRHLPAHTYTNTPSRDQKENLFDIENEVQHVADKLSPLDLVELENVIKEMRAKSVDENNNNSIEVTPIKHNEDLISDIPLSMQTRRDNLQTKNDSVLVFSKQVSKHTNYKLELRPKDAEALKLQLSNVKDFNFNTENKNAKLSSPDALHSYDQLQSDQPIISFYQSRHEKVFDANDNFMPQTPDKVSENYRNSQTSSSTSRPAAYDVQQGTYRYHNNKPIRGRTYVYPIEQFNHKPKAPQGPTYYNHQLSMFDLFE